MSDLSFYHSVTIYGMTRNLSFGTFTLLAAMFVLERK